MELRDLIWLVITAMLFFFVIIALDVRDGKIEERRQENEVLAKRMSNVEHENARLKFTLDSLMIRKTIEDKWNARPMYESEPLLSH